jgi:hypothetical protein
MGNKEKAEADRKRAIALDSSFASRPPPNWTVRKPRKE